VKLKLIKPKNQLHPEVYVDGVLEENVKKITLHTWVNGHGNVSEQVEVTVRTNGKEIHVKGMENLEIDLDFLCGLSLKTTKRGIGCFFGKSRVCLTQSLKYISDSSSLPKLELEIVAT
jgi:hypothetical protein